MVVLNCEALRAMCAEQARSIAWLARATGDHEQTIAHLLKTKGFGKCRQSRRRALAKALGVSERELTEQNPVDPALEMAPGREYMYSARTQRAAQHFITRCRTACERQFPGDDAEAMECRTDVLRRLLELVQLRRWRSRLLRLPGKVEEMKLWTTSGQQTRVPDYEEAVLQLIGAMSYVLAPWLDGAASLDLKALRQLTRAGAAPSWPIASRAPSPALLPSAAAVPLLNSTRVAPQREAVSLNDITRRDQEYDRASSERTRPVPKRTSRARGHAKRKGKA